MLEKITGTFSNIIRTMSGKSTITEKNIEETEKYDPCTEEKAGNCLYICQSGFSSKA